VGNALKYAHAGVFVRRSRSSDQIARIETFLSQPVSVGQAGRTGDDAMFDQTFLDGAVKTNKSWTVTISFAAEFAAMGS
jgi:hypothetical protein